MMREHVALGYNYGGDKSVIKIIELDVFAQWARYKG